MYTEERKEYLLNWKKQKMKRVPLDIRVDGDGLTYDQLKSAAESVGEPVNVFIKKAIEMRMMAMGLK